MLLALLWDVLLVVAFALVGRRAHSESAALFGVITTAWPFVVGLFVGWFFGLRRLRNPRALQFGLLVWGTTLFVGMGLRGVTGAGTALSFVIVAAVVLAALLLGWRLLSAYAARSRG